jgi:hypothetical protein
MMKRHFPEIKTNLFKASVRHYHRSGASDQPAWTEWGDDPSTRGKVRKVLHIALIVMVTLALGAIIVGLFIELR